MTGMRDFTREQWLALKPEIYLADGFLDQTGALNNDFLSDYATAAAMQLLAAETSPQELAMTFEGLRLILPMHEGAAPVRLGAALDETLVVVARAMRQTNNEGMVNWLNQCASAVTTPAELDGFLAHVQTVMRLYGMMVAALPEEPSGSSLPS